MSVPKTRGVLRTSIADMQIGDYIVWKADNGIWKMDGDNVGFTEMPYGGLSNGTSFQGYYWYGVKVAKGLIISDRIRTHSVSWDTLNGNKDIQGKPIDIDNNGTIVTGEMRSLTGGNAYADANGNKSLTELNASYDAFPNNNEYDKYIMRFPTELISSGYALEDIFHYKSIATWVQDTPMNGTWTSVNGGTNTGSSDKRMYRGYDSRTDGWTNKYFSLSSGSYTVVGFRPVFAYDEV